MVVLAQVVDRRFAKEAVMSERRKAVRKDLVYYSRVADGITGRDLGNLINITPKGAMVLCERPVEVDKVMQLLIELPDGLTGKPRLVMEAKACGARRTSTRNSMMLVLGSPHFSG
jgi:hypothetical protein